MAKFFIPETLSKGFLKLINTADRELQLIAEAMLEFDVSAKPRDFFHLLEKTNISDIEDISQTIFGMGFLLIENSDHEDLAKSLLSSYSVNNVDIDPENPEFVRKLKYIFDHSAKVMINHKAIGLYTSSKYIYRSSNLITDIRPVFNGNVAEGGRYAMITQQLKIVYSDNGDDQTTFISMDLTDLNALRSQIDRAIEKQETLMTDCGELFKFIEFGN
ncbi:hypothetical protein [Pedobacter hiemivivus]|uniref:Uncharacterized protein n=1 Tax=Pedobacter hiemivivus TaxID=2530454 RepID=A0A4R0NDM2_9SPHI|nr:hypothetical protein [Pedobacter hiemivivus]TCC98491.1 hypothetical protein EZ444_04195 [Pedobacter hiemivivus]